MPADNLPLQDVLQRYRQERQNLPSASGLGRVADHLVEMLVPSSDEVATSRDRCEARLFNFVKEAWHVLEPSEFVNGWHIGCICEHLEAMTAGQIMKLIISVPPRHGKSLLTCVFWFAWVWTHQPESRWLYSSYSDSLASRDSMKCLDLIRSQWYQDRWSWKYRLRSNQRAVSRFSNNKTGYRIATSVMGRGLGEGGDYIVCFPGHVRVLTSSGLVPIGKVVESQDDYLIATFNHEENKVEWKPVLEKMRHASITDFVSLWVSGREIQMTCNHPVFVVGRGYVPASDVVVGDNVLLHEDGGLQDHPVTSVGRFSGRMTVYNLNVADNHNYFAEGLLVHNCDDPNKATEIHSATMRERVNSWWSGTMSTRSGRDPSLVRKLIQQQRLHARDLSGYTYDSDFGYECLVLPCEYEPCRYFFPTPEMPAPPQKIRDQIVPTSLQLRCPHLMDPRREDGELLWPERFGPEQVEELKKELMGVGTAGQLQQRPSPADGDVFKKEKFAYFVQETTAWNNDPSRLVPCYRLQPLGMEAPLHIPTSWCRHFIAADTALKPGSKSSYTACGLFASAPLYQREIMIARYLLIIDVERRKLTVPEQFPFLLDYWDRHKDAIFLAVEPKASGIGLIQQAAAAGRPFKTLTVDGDKVKRASPLAGLYESKLVLHRQDMPILADFEDELLSFPQGQFNDMVDLSSHAGILFTHETILSLPYQGTNYAYPQEGDLPQQDGIFRVAGVDVEFADDDAPPEWWR